MHLSSLLPFAVSAVLIPHTYAWGAVGHEVVATIAQMHLHPSVMPKLCDLLDVDEESCHLAPIAAWADRIRRQSRYRWTGPLHYIGAVDDYPSSICAFPGEDGWKGRTHINVLHAIRNTTTVLQEFEEYRRAGAELDYEFYDEDEDEDEDEDGNVPRYVQDALKFLIHFLGDMHQPLHLTGRNRGGNGDKVAFDGRTTKLHTVWDSLLIAERLRTIPRNYTRPLPLRDVEFHLRDTIYDPYIRRIVWEGLLGQWKDELEDWLFCPSSLTSAASKPMSTWQTVLSLFRGRREYDEDVEDGGLGVDDDKLCPYAWAEPIHQLNCEIVVPEELDSFAPQDDDAEEEWYCGHVQDDEADDENVVDVDAKEDADVGGVSAEKVAEGADMEDEDIDEDVEDVGDADADEDVDEEDVDEEDVDDVDEDEEDLDLEDVRAEDVSISRSKFLELDTPEYAGVIKERWIVEKLLAQGGIRLAAVLNWIFAEPGEDELTSYLTL